METSMTIYLNNYIYVNPADLLRLYKMTLYTQYSIKGPRILLVDSPQDRVNMWTLTTSI